MHPPQILPRSSAFEAQADQEFRFDQFRLLRSRRLLLENDRPIRLGSRALDLLTALLERAGELVSKEDLLAYAWPTTIVEETSLRFHMSSLRKALGDGQQGARFIANVSGRGYCFVAKVERIDHGRLSKGPTICTPEHAHNLPVRLTRIIGRTTLVDSIARLLPERRFISIVGPGGMGKSTLALAICDEVLASYPQGAWFVDLSPLSDAALVPSALATVLGVGIDEAEPMRNLCAFLRDKHMLIVLDTCERLIEGVAVLAEGLLTSGKDIHVIATSREPLGAKGEWIQRLPPLYVPDSHGELTASEAMAFPAVQLFVERAVASLDGFELHDWEAASAVGICRRLDGMPFAIELAAAHVDAFGVSGLLVQLNDRFPLLSQGRRAVPERHQTLRALLDWGYELLTEPERKLLRHLAVFPAAFTMEAAEAVAPDGGATGADVSDGIVSLAAKSLVVVIASGDEVRYRLLDTTRAYALERLEQDSEADEVRRRHASYLCDVLAHAEVEWMTMTRIEWSASYAGHIDDVRVALDWAIGSPNELITNVRLAAGAGELAHHLSLQAEFLRRIDQAMERYRAGSQHDPLLELHLCNSLAGLRLTLLGFGPDIGVLFARSLEMANELDSDRYREEAIHGLFVAAFGEADYPLAGKHAEALGRLACQADDASMALTADRLKAQVLFKMGSLNDSKRLAERVLRHPMVQMRLGCPYPMDRRVSMRILLAQILWIEGNPEQAIQVAIEGLELSEAEPAFGQCVALAWAACPIALWMGDLDLARTFIERFQRHSTRYSFAFQAAWARDYARVLAFRAHPQAEADPKDEGDVNAGVTLAAVSDVMGTMGEQFLTDEAIWRLESGRAGWCAPEILRAQGDRAMRRGRKEDEAEAASFYDQSLRLAQQQGALSWELRTATSIAALKRKQGRAQEGHELLKAAFDKFTEGFKTDDLMQAKAVLEALERELADSQDRKPLAPWHRDA